MKIVTGVLVVILLLLQYPLWLSKNSWIKMSDVNQQLEYLQNENQKLLARNAILDAEVRDLKQGTDAIEERARNNLGMVRSDEIFFQTMNDGKQK